MEECLPPVVDKRLCVDQACSQVIWSYRSLPIVYADESNSGITTRNLKFPTFAVGRRKAAGLEPDTGSAYDAGCIMGKYFKSQKGR